MIEDIVAAKQAGDTGVCSLCCAAWLMCALNERTSCWHVGWRRLLLMAPSSNRDIIYDDTPIRSQDWLIEQLKIGAIITHKPIRD